MATFPPDQPHLMLEFPGIGGAAADIAKFLPGCAKADPLYQGGIGL